MWAFRKDSPKSYLKESAPTPLFSKQSCCLSFRIKYFLLFVLVLYTHRLFPQWNYKHLEENNALSFLNKTCCCLGSDVTGPGWESGWGAEPRWGRGGGGPGWAITAAPNLHEAYLRARPCSKLSSHMSPFSPQRNLFYRWGNRSSGSWNNCQCCITRSCAARTHAQAIGWGPSHSPASLHSLFFICNHGEILPSKVVGFNCITSN